MNQGVEIIDSGTMMQSWGCSIALHGALWGLGFCLITQQAVVSKPVFQWEVSLVSSSQKSSSDALLSEASSQAHNRIRPAVMKSAGKSTAAAPSVQSVIHTTQVAREPVLSEAGTASSPSVAAVAVPNPSEADHPTELPSRDMAAPPQILGESQSAVDNDTQSPHTPSIQSAVAADHLADGSSDPPTHATVPSSTVTNASSFETKADFGWLMQMLWGRIMDLKRYPHEARMNRWEGRVIVRVVINEQGQLLDAAVAMGSGYEVLDRAALEAIKESCPLPLSQPLGRERIVLRIPIQYKLSS